MFSHLVRRILGWTGPVALVLFASNASADLIDYSTVAVEDTLLQGVDLANSGSPTEEQFLADYLGLSVDDVNFAKIDLNGQDSFDEVINDPAGTDLWAVDFYSYGVLDPVLFLVKLGNAQYSHYLYDNLPSLQYGVIDLNMG